MVRRDTPVCNGKAGAAFDAWLRQELVAQYDAMLAEPVPAELLMLLDGAA